MAETTPPFDLRVFIIFAASFLLNSDQNMLAPHLTAISREFGMDADQRDEKLGGELAAGLFLLGAPATLAIGFAADRVPRKWLLVFIIVLGGVASLGTASAQNFPQLFGWRALTGISLGAAFPLNFSLLADLFPPARRTSMSGRFGLSIASGQAFGQALSGFVGGPLGWRAPFILVGGLFLALAGVVIAFFCEPARGACDGRAGDAGGGVTSKAAGRDLFQLFTTPTVLLVFLQGIPGCVPWSIIGTYLNDFVHVNLHLSVQHATLVLTALAVGGFAGQLVGGEVGQRLYLWKKPACCCQMGVSKVFSILFLVLILLTDTRAFPRLAAFAVALGFWASQTGPIVYSCLQNTTSPGTRASAFAVLAIFDDLGKGGGPWVVAKLVRAYGRRRAFVLATITGWGLSGLLTLSIACTLAADERRLRGAGDEYKPLAKEDVEDVSVDDETMGSVVHRRGVHAADS
mmetsp:Transcript_1099/g.3271  ORF Transcript_1099/g.3271 Transcript_1099/m.3271 type:complete len:460 (+) Transcript_1099:370-1749(+)